MASSAQVAPEIPDEEIVRTFQETGRNECFAELFVRHRRRVFLACRGFFADSGGAEDATQETFLRAFRNIHRFHGGNFAGWLLQIARNVCIDAWRKRRPEAGTEDVELSERPTVRVEYSSAAMLLVVEQVWREMKTLSPEQRQCLELKIEGYSYEETATRTGLPIEAVKSHLQNGRRMLWLKTQGILSGLK
jgi:RNA polymerase sigma-70 factor (ECF subfamily)